MKILFVIAGLALSLSHLQGFANEDSANLVVTACKADCPKAKTDEEAHKCAEKKGRLNKEFRKSKCWEVNEEYEKKAAASAAAEKKATLTE